MSRSYITRLILVLLLGLGLHEVSNLIFYFNPNTANIYPEHLYLDRGYQQPKISVLYYFYELTPYIDNVIKSAISYRIAVTISPRLGMVFLVFVGLYLTQVLFYVWDRNTSILANYCLYSAIFLICMSIIYPDKEVGKYRRIKTKTN